MIIKQIFFSHAIIDETISSAIYNLLQKFLDDFGLKETFKLFYSPVNLNQMTKKDQRWPEAIRNAMESSTCCLVLVTPSSINNKWVNYELGLAKAYGKPVIPIGIYGIQYNQFIHSDTQVRSLEKKDNYPFLIATLFNDEGRIGEREIENWLSKPNISQRIDDIVYSAKKRTVYIVGSKPEKGVFVSKFKYVSDFLESICTSLLKNNCIICSYPSVEDVGKIVADCVIDKDPSKYEIAGLYKFDKDLKEFSKNSAVGMAKWDKILTKFRRLYLEGKDFMIIVGGSSSTKEEYNVALERKSLQIIPIPCFGGFGKELFDIQSQNHEYEEFCHPCLGCNGLDRGRCPRIKEIIERLFIYKPLNRVSINNE